MRISKETFIKNMDLQLDAIIEHVDRYTKNVFKIEELYSNSRNRAYRYDVDEDAFYYLATDVQYVTEYVSDCNEYYKNEDQNNFCYIAEVISNDYKI